MQQQRQEIYLGKAPHSRYITGMLLWLFSAVAVGFGFLLTGSEQVRHSSDWKGIAARVAVQLVVLVVAWRLLPLTRRLHKLTLVGQFVSVQVNERLIWEKKCAAWRWRKSDKKNTVGVELLDDEGQAYLVQLEWIPLGTGEPFARLVKALERAGVRETETLEKRLPFSKDVGAWLGLALALLGIAGIGWLVWSPFHAADGIRVPAGGVSSLEQPYRDLRYRRPVVRPQRAVLSQKGVEKERRKL